MGNNESGTFGIQQKSRKGVISIFLSLFAFFTVNEKEVTRN